LLGAGAETRSATTTRTKNFFIFPLPHAARVRSKTLITGAWLGLGSVLVLFKLLLNGTPVEVANGRDVVASTIVLNGGPPAVAGATLVIEMGMATGMR